MNTILLQKILDILKEGLAHVGDFFKDLFVTDPQDGQVIGYDADAGKWKNVDLTELSFDITHEAGPADSITITGAAADMHVKSLTVDMVSQQESGTPSPSNPLAISGTDSIVITHTYGDNVTEIKTIDLHSTVYGGEVDVVTGKLVITHGYYTFDGTETPLVYGNGYRYVVLSGKEAKSYGQAEIPNLICNEYNATTRQRIQDGTPGISITGDTILLSTNTPRGVQVVYELATPIEINLTPTTIKTQGGSETFAVDANEMELEYYTATAGTIKDLVCITEDITSEITKNTTDFSDILLKVSQNNKVVSVEIYSATTSAAINDTFLSNLPKPAMNCKVLLANTTLGEDGTILGTLKTSGELEIATSGAKSFSGLITYVVK